MTVPDSAADCRCNGPDQKHPRRRFIDCGIERGEDDHIELSGLSGAQQQHPPSPGARADRCHGSGCDTAVPRNQTGIRASREITRQSRIMRRSDRRGRNGVFASCSAASSSARQGIGGHQAAAYASNTRERAIARNSHSHRSGARDSPGVMALCPSITQHFGVAGSCSGLGLSKLIAAPRRQSGQGPQMRPGGIHRHRGAGTE